MRNKHRFCFENTEKGEHKMRKLVFFTSMCVLCGAAMTAVPAYADGGIPTLHELDAERMDLDTALQRTYITCAGIDEGLADMKKMAGINTAVSGVGTGLAVGDAVVGFSKAKLDKEIDKLEEMLAEKSVDQFGTSLGELDPNFAQKYGLNENLTVSQGNSSLEEATAKSKKLGNWRTGLMAGTTATQVASAIIAAKNRVSEDLQGQVDECIASVKMLQRAIAEARMNGEDVTEAQRIYSTCREYEYVDLSPIDKRAKGAMISSTIAAVTGGVGTVTSAMANTDATRNDNTDEGKKKEKNLNTASNALAVGSGVAGATATIFNATQIAAIKKVASVSEKCTEVLK